MEKIIVGNLKENLLTIAERNQYISSLKHSLGGKHFEKTKLIVCPPSVHLEEIAESLKDENIAAGAQNIFWEERGSFTGEISAKMVKEVGGEYVLVGHSERRKYFGETEEMANAKIKAAFKANLIPVYCIGETQDERAKGLIGEVLTGQIVKAFAEIGTMNISKIVLAYEPVWAIGSDKTPTTDELLGVKILIKKILSKHYSVSVSEKVNILYGGSVKASIVKQVCVDPGLDGVLVGRESLIPSEFVKIAEIISKN